MFDNVFLAYCMFNKYKQNVLSIHTIMGKKEAWLGVLHLKTNLFFKNMPIYLHA